MSNEQDPKEGLNGPALAIALDDIIRMSKEDVPRLPAAVFIGALLTPLTQRDIPQFRENWHRVAGALQRPIDVVDAAGELIQRAPSLVMQVPGRYSEGHRVSLAEISEQAAKYAEYNGRMGEMYMADNMRGRNIPVIGHAQAMLDWNTLATKLGQPLPFEGLSAATAKRIGSSAGDTGANDQPMFSQEDDEDF